jgi:hypothetical protein
MKRILILWLATVFAASLHAQVLPDDAIVEGKTIGEWTAEWWKWVFSIPTNQNPFFDLDGSLVHNGQSGPVFFGPGGTPLLPGPPLLTLRYSMPEDTYLLLPIIAGEADNIDTDPPFTVEELRDFLASGNAITELHATVDGVAIPFIQESGSEFFNHRVMSPIFSFEFTSVDNEYTAVAGHPIVGLVDPIVSDGYWLMIAPLAPGIHQLETGATMGLPPVSRSWIHEITVIPIPLSQRVNELVSLVQWVDLAQNRFQPLLASLQVANGSFDSGHVNAAINQLRAFQNKVRAQVAPNDPALADILSQTAQRIIDKAASQLTTP